MYVFQPRSPRISAIVRVLERDVPFAFGNPVAASVMQAMLFVVWLRPVIRHERVGEHSAVVWKACSETPRSAIRLMFGVSISPP